MIWKILDRRLDAALDIDVRRKRQTDARRIDHLHTVNFTIFKTLNVQTFISTHLIPHVIRMNHKIEVIAPFFKIKNIAKRSFSHQPPAMRYTPPQVLENTCS